MKIIEANPKRSNKRIGKMTPIKELFKEGITDEMSNEAFDSAELEKGIRVELEHTDDEVLAKKIAKDHLEKDPDYYKKLAKIESDSKTKNNPIPLTKMYLNLYMVSIFKIIENEKEKFEINLTYDNRDKHFEINKVVMPSYCCQTKTYNFEHQEEMRKDSSKFFSNEDLERFYVGVRGFKQAELFAKNPTTKEHNEISEKLFNDRISDLSSLILNSNRHDAELYRFDMGLISKAMKSNNISELIKLLNKNVSIETAKCIVYKLAHLIEKEQGYHSK